MTSPYASDSDFAEPTQPGRRPGPGERSPAARRELLPPDSAAASASVGVQDLARSGRFRTATGRAAVTTDANWRLAMALMDTASAPVVVADADGHICAANVHFCAAHGFVARELEGTPLRTLVRDADGPGIAALPLSRLCALGPWRGEALLRRQSGRFVGVRVDAKTVWDGAAAPCYFVVRFERTARRSDDNSTARAMDTTTGLPRWALLRAILTRKLEQAEASAGRVVVMLIDALHLRTVDRALGHAVGRRIRSELARRLNLAIRSRDTLSRLTGDTFGLVCSDLPDVAAVAAVAEQAMQAAAVPFQEGDRAIHIAVRVGIAMFPDDAKGIDDLLQHAEIALATIPEGGQSAYRFFSNGMQDRIVRRVSVESALRGAAERDELSLVYQPRVDLATRKLSGAEALLRWHHPDLGPVSPAEFIPVAEEVGIIEELGAWVLSEACTQYARWQAAGVAPPRLSVNVSGHQLRSLFFVDTVCETLARTGVPPGAIELELTESVLMGDVSENRARLDALHELGVRIAVDDFGTGYSSLAYLQRFPVDILKIDRSFISGLPDDDDSAAIVTAIIHMARALRITVVAEGVETAAQLAFVAKLRCAEAQGYLFGKGVAADAFVRRHER